MRFFKNIILYISTKLYVKVFVYALVYIERQYSF